MKILFTHHRYHTNLFNWFRGFQQSGHSVRLLVYKPDEVNQPDLPQSDFLPPSKWSVKKMQKNPRKRGDGVDSFSPYYYPSFKALYQYFKTEKPHLVVIRPVFTRFGYLTLLIALLFRCRIVFHSRIRIHRHYSKQKLLVFKVALGMLNAYWMSPCKGNPDKYPLASKRLIYFPFLIEPKFGSREYFENGKVNILCVAKYFESKNPKMMLEVFLKLREEFEDIKLTICGSGDPVGAYYQNMQKLNNDSNFSDDIELLINQPLERMRELYQSHDVFVLPTRHDPASFTVLEGMSFGLAVMTTNVDGSSGYIENEKNGFILEKDNIEMLNKKINSLLNQKLKIEEMGLKSLEIVQRNHKPLKGTIEFLGNLE